ncbi:hypothetical protein AVEN_41947-1 [Araneus ventricosus]|uniref:SCAN box domain-containing protein n=1 Tax=Araneus ventricosus TaxID=182803 RepID=A0A4Y2TAH8_ARAVE|nr:hypothetical protein AVEN_41947-1 [Araneus ventricosus]
MAYLVKGRREDMFVLTKELDLEPNTSMTIKKLKDLITNDTNYDEEFTKNIYAGIVEQRKAKEELEEKQRQEVLAELRRKDEVEQERLKIEAQLKFEVKEDISLYLILFERQVHRLTIPKEHWVSYLLGLLPPEISHIIAREPDEKADDYDHVKELLLKRFKLTLEKFRQLFSTHQKAYNRTWTDYYRELATYFDGWILDLKIETYEDLRNSPDKLAEEYEDIKKTLKQKASGAYFKNKQDFKGAEKYRKFESPRKFEHNRTDKKFSTSTGYNRHHANQAKSYENQQRSHGNSNRGYSRNNEREKYSSCNAPKHAQTNYSKFRRFKDPQRESNTDKPKKATNSTKEINKSAETCAIIRKESLRTKEIIFGKKKSQHSSTPEVQSVYYEKIQADESLIQRS